MLSRSALLAILVPIAFAPASMAAPSGSGGAGLALVNRLSWGETAQGDTLRGLSPTAWLEGQLHPSADDGLPPNVRAMIAGMEISQKPLEEIATEARQMQLAIRDARKESSAHGTWEGWGCRPR